MSNVLARLAPKTLVPTGEGFGGHLRLEQCDIAHALCGLPDGQACLLRAMYAGDTGEGNMRGLYLWAWKEAVRVSVSNRWDIPGGRKTLRILSSRAIDELVYPRLVKCQNCGGTGEVQPNQHNPSGECGKCGKTGQANPPDEVMAGLIGVTVSEWRSVWVKRFAVLYATFLSWESQGRKHVYERLKDGE